MEKTLASLRNTVKVWTHSSVDWSEIETFKINKALVEILQQCEVLNYVQVTIPNDVIALINRLTAELTSRYLLML